MSDQKCFVVMPFGKKPNPRAENETFDFDKIYRVIMQPAIRAAGFEPIRADESSSSGLIHGDMFRELRDRSVVLADLSLQNPNVFYELGIRHVMAQRGTVLTCENNTNLPFDVRLSRVIKYEYDGKSLDWEEAERAKPLLTNALTDSVTQPDSPVHALLEQVLQDATTQFELNLDSGFAQGDTDKTLGKYVHIIADHLQSASPRLNVSELLNEHQESPFGMSAVAEFLLRSQDELPEEAVEVAARLRILGMFASAARLYARLDKDEKLEPWRYMQYGSVESEADRSEDSARRGLKIQDRGLARAKEDFMAHPDDDERRWDYAYCLLQIGVMKEWLWRVTGRQRLAYLKVSIEAQERAIEVFTGKNARLPNWVNLIARLHIRLLFLLRARDGTIDRPDGEGHLEAILALKPQPDSTAAERSSLVWYQVIARIDKGDEKGSMNGAIQQLAIDANLAADDRSFNRPQLYYLTRRFTSDNTDYLRNARLWEPIAQLLKSATNPSS